MEEKIFQKQLRKGELESLVIDDGGDKTTRNFDSSDLKDIFILERTACESFDVLAGNGVVSKNQSARVPLDQLHEMCVAGYRCTRPGSNGVLGSGGVGGEAGAEDACLAQSVTACAPVVSFIMVRTVCI